MHIIRERANTTASQMLAREKESPLSERPEF